MYLKLVVCMSRMVNNMKCHKCKFDNIVKASYCHNCGEKFADKEKEEAYNKTIYGKIEKLEKIKDIASLDIITGNIIFKICSLLIVLGIGIYFLFTMGWNTKILNSIDYKLFYNTSDNGYYILVDDNIDSVDVSLYRPNRLKKMIINHYDLDNNLVEKREIKKEDKVELNASSNDYYIIESKYSNKKQGKIKVVVYHKSDVEN